MIWMNYWGKDTQKSDTLAQNPRKMFNTTAFLSHFLTNCLKANPYNGFGTGLAPR